MSLYSLLAKIFKMRYNGGTIGKEVPTVEEKTKKTLSDYGLGVLYYKCKKIRASTLDGIAKYSDLVNMISEYNGPYTDETICDIVSDYALAVITRRKNYAGIKKLARSMQKDVYGSYLPGFNNEELVPQPPSDLAYLLPILADLRSAPKRNLFEDEAFIKVVRKSSPITSIEQAYRLYFSIFAQKVRYGIKGSDNQAYRSMRVIVRDFCRVIYGNADHWRSDYEAYWSNK